MGSNDSHRFLESMINCNSFSAYVRTYRSATVQARRPTKIGVLWWNQKQNKRQLGSAKQ